MGLLLDAFVLPPGHVLVSKMGAELVLLNLQTERYFGLDDVGTRMWEAMGSGSTLRAAHARLSQEYEVDPALLERDLLMWAAQMVEGGLLEVRNEQIEQAATDIRQ